MIRPGDALSALRATGIDFVCGVPDSLLRPFCTALAEALPPERHVITANEGAAVGMAVGHYLATARPALVYLQNSGLGNAVNPLTSLAAPEVFGIPMVLMVGWRGEVMDGGAQRPDEPQHRLQGQITLGQLDLLRIPHRVVGPLDHLEEIFPWAVAETLAMDGPVALVIRAGTFAPWSGAREPEDAEPLTREGAITAVLDALPRGTPVVSTTGMASRELFEVRHRRGEPHDADFLTVGGMGHALSIAAGIARMRAGAVVCLDGDGALLMHLGALAEAATLDNLIHVVLNNGAHDSVGGQPTAARHLPLSAFARAARNPLVLEARGAEEVGGAVAQLVGAGRGFLEIRCRRGARPDLGRPDVPPHAIRDGFMRHLRGG